jgi:hypothetical protein
MGFGRYEYRPPIGVVSMVRWLIDKGIGYMIWRGVYEREKLETIRRALQKTMRCR